MWHILRRVPRWKAKLHDRDLPFHPAGIITPALEIWWREHRGRWVEVIAVPQASSTCRKPVYEVVGGNGVGICDCVAEIYKEAVRPRHLRATSELSPFGFKP